MSMKDAAEFGVAASALKHTIPGARRHEPRYPQRSTGIDERRWKWKSAEINQRIMYYVRITIYNLLITNYQLKS